MSIAKLEWHDGILEAINIAASGEVNISCSCYEVEDSKIRVVFCITCYEVVSMSNVIDFSALIDNRRSGNINNGRLGTPSKGVSVLKLFLTDGYVEIAAKKITFKKTEE